jgi:hypothetical protein
VQLAAVEMNLIELTTKDVCHLLRSNGLSEETLDIFSENDIDGESVVSLLSDIEEFAYLVPQSGTRMKIKKIIKQAEQGQPADTASIDADQGSFVNEPSEDDAHKHLNEHLDNLDDLSVPSKDNSEQLTQLNELELLYSKEFI